MGIAAVWNKFWALIVFVVCMSAVAHGITGQKIIRYEVLDASVVYIHKRVMTEKGPIHVHSIRIKPDDPLVIIRPVLARGGLGRLERTTSMQWRSDAIAAVNGSFYEPRRVGQHWPIGLLVIDGQVITKSTLNRTAMGILPKNQLVFGIPKMKGEVISLGSGKSVPVWGMNRPRKRDEVVVYTDEYGSRTRTNHTGTELVVEGTTITTVTDGNSQIPENGFVISLHGSSKSFTDRLPVGSEVVLKFVLTDGWERAVHILTGGPRLLEDGNIVVHRSVAKENFRGGILRPTARTVVGLMENGDILFYVFEARKKRSRGLTYSMLAHVLKKEGVRNAMALDGGNSTTMAVRGRMVNVPVNQGERWVSNALVVKIAKAPLQNSEGGVEK